MFGLHIEGKLARMTRQKINAGESKREVFYDLWYATHKPAGTVAEVIQFIPTIVNRKRYQILHWVLLFFAALIVVMDAWYLKLSWDENGFEDALHLAIWIVSATFFIYKGIQQNGVAYRGIAFIMASTHAMVIVQIIIEWSELTGLDQKIEVSLYSGFILITIFLGVFLNWKVTPGYNTKKVKKKLPNGKIKQDLLIRFYDDPKEVQAASHQQATR